jgi:hypothetical protein
MIIIVATVIHIFMDQSRCEAKSRSTNEEILRRFEMRSLATMFTKAS